MTAQEAGNFMRAFGDGTRLRIVSVLSVHPTTVGDLSRILKCPEKRVSRHLRYLHARGVVVWRSVRKGARYELAAPANALHLAALGALQKTLPAIDETAQDQARLGHLPRP